MLGAVLIEQEEVLHTAIRRKMTRSENWIIMADTISSKS